jgi:hypothetical protein
MDDVAAHGGEVLDGDMQQIKHYFMESDKCFFVINRQNPKRNAKGELTDELIDGITVHIGKMSGVVSAESLVETAGPVYGGDDTLSDISYASTRLEAGGFIINMVPAITAALKLQREADRKKVEPKRVWKWPGYACLPRAMFSEVIAKYVTQINEVGASLADTAGEEWAPVACDWDESEGDSGTGVIVSIDDESAPRGSCTKSGTFLALGPTIALSFRVASRDLEIGDNISFLSGKRLIFQVKVKCGTRNVQTVFWDAGTYSNAAGINAKVITGHGTVVANLVRIGMAQDVANGLALALTASEVDIKSDDEVKARHTTAITVLQKRARTSLMKISVSSSNFADELVAASREFDAEKDATDAAAAGGGAAAGSEQKRPRLP